MNSPHHKKKKKMHKRQTQGIINFLVKTKSEFVPNTTIFKPRAFKISVSIQKLLNFIVILTAN